MSVLPRFRLVWTSLNRPNPTAPVLRKKLRNWLKALVVTPPRYATRPTVKLNVFSARLALTLREKLTKPWRPPNASLKLKPVQPVKLYAAK